MKAMVLAAGYGTRLHPLTLHTPKALVEIAGRPLLDIVLSHLYLHRFSEIAINVHHHTSRMQEHIGRLTFEGMQIKISYEETILGTGGGIKKMIPLLGDDEPILVHNVDVLTDLDLAALLQRHLRSGAAATLAVQSRDTKRHLIFDESGCLCGRLSVEKSEPHFVRTPEGGVGFRAFNGIQVIDPVPFLRHPEQQFSSVDLYLELAGHGEKIMEYRMDGHYWRDLGKPDDLAEAEKDIRAGRITTY